jgi:DNA polymerase
MAMNPVINRVETLKVLRNTLIGYLNLGINEVEFEKHKSNKHKSKKHLLTSLMNEVFNCRKCPLYKGKKNYVFGEGDTDASLMFVGEAPGYYEDVDGKPFVGKAGKLLTKIIKAMGFERDNVYISNILKCRPPNNRDPLQEEIESCLPYLKRQIELVNPEIICTLGRFAAQTLIGTDVTISNLRGRIFNYKRRKLIPVFHPSFLLRNPKYKKETWEDMQMICRILGKEIEKNG